MSWLKKLFVKSDTNQVVNENSPSGWYFKRSKDGKIAQVVLSAPVSCIKETDFGMIMLPYDKFPILASQPWCSGFIRMENKPVPYLMIRVDEFDKEVEKTDLTIAFSFCQLPSGGIFLIDTRIESHAMGKSVRKKFPFLPPINKPVVEWLVSLDDKYSLQMMKEVFSSSELHIIIANSKGANTTIMDNNGSFIDCLGPCAHHDRLVNFDHKLNDLLRTELDLLFDYHKSVPGSRRSFQQANQELGYLLPFDKDPIIAPEV